MNQSDICWKVERFPDNNRTSFNAILEASIVSSWMLQKQQQGACWKELQNTAYTTKFIPKKKGDKSAILEF